VRWFNGCPSLQPITFRFLIHVNFSVRANTDEAKAAAARERGAKGAAWNMIAGISIWIAGGWNGLRHTLGAMLAAEGASAATGVAGREVAVDVDRRFPFFGIRVHLDLDGLT
jgi:hypothetical protein